MIHIAAGLAPESGEVLFVVVVVVEVYQRQISKVGRAGGTEEEDCSPRADPSNGIA